MCCRVLNRLKGVGDRLKPTSRDWRGTYVPRTSHLFGGGRLLTSRGLAGGTSVPVVTVVKLLLEVGVLDGPAT